VQAELAATASISQPRLHRVVVQPAIEMAAMGGSAGLAAASPSPFAGGGADAAAATLPLDFNVITIPSPSGSGNKLALQRCPLLCAHEPVAIRL
jgi:hypothetical protein